jgi:hypothetical protein
VGILLAIILCNFGGNNFGKYTFGWNIILPGILRPRMLISVECYFAEMFWAIILFSGGILLYGTNTLAYTIIFGGKNFGGKIFGGNIFGGIFFSP